MSLRHFNIYLLKYIYIYLLLIYKLHYLYLNVETLNITLARAVLIDTELNKYINRLFDESNTVERRYRGRKYIN